MRSHRTWYACTSHDNEMNKSVYPSVPSDKPFTQITLYHVYVPKKDNKKGQVHSCYNDSTKKMCVVCSTRPENHLNIPYNFAAKTDKRKANKSKNKHPHLSSHRMQRTGEEKVWFTYRKDGWCVYVCALCVSARGCRVVCAWRGCVACEGKWNACVVL